MVDTLGVWSIFYFLVKYTSHSSFLALEHADDTMLSLRLHTSASQTSGRCHGGSVNVFYAVCIPAQGASESRKIYVNIIKKNLKYENNE